MGALILPTSGLVYIDAMVFIYTVERYPAYWPLLEPMWQAAKTGAIAVVTSELTIMESLASPLKTGNAVIESAFEQALQGTDLRLLPITQAVLRDAARLRATASLKTPDALHVATAQQSGCALLVSNDVAFRRLTGLPVAILDDHLTP